MLRHILLFKFNEGAAEEDRVDAIQRLHELGPQCPTVSAWSIGLNEADSKSAYDVAEVADFDDEAALQAYKEHPAHKEFSAFIGTVATWALVDYHFEPEQAYERRERALQALRRMQGRIVPVVNDEMVPVSWVLDVVNDGLGIPKP